ncbi:translocation/assembly module TamB domain-containing protein [Ancylomarina longa]|uniref:translocation/assembly module TamB domain-containing protein n=1 Tax=Ancylomarina longa TaxID=2487017 RepID=UPI000FCC5B34|nr:translocation/assembly module TamB domain-containing protein [Ancylomarina longa]
MSIQGVNISPFKSIIIKGLYVEDYQKDTLVYVGNLKVKIDSFNLDTKHIYVNKLSLSKTFVNLYEDKNRILNMEVFLDSLRNKNATPAIDTTKKSWITLVSNIDISDSQFGYKTVAAKTQKFGINYDDILVKNIYLKARDIKVIGDSINFQIQHLSCSEKSGFKLKDFKANSWVTSHQWGLTDVKISATHSELNAKYLHFNYEPGKGYWRKFTKKMQLDFLLNSSKISFLDVAYFNDELEGFRETGRIKGHIYGTVFDLKGKDIDVIYGEQTILKGQFYMNGLPYLRDAYLEANFDELTTSIADIEKVYIPGYDKENLNFPEYFSNLGLIHYKGKFNGFINDFVFYGNFKTDLGSIKTDILFKPNKKDNRLVFNGDLKTTDFNLGGFLEQDKVGTVSLNVSVNGSTDEETTKGIMKGNISNLNFNDYEYKNLSLDGFFSQSQFDGKISIQDPNIGFDFAGKIDFSQKVPTMNFSSHILHAKLFPLHLSKKDLKSELSLSINANFTGSGVDNANGIIEINNTNYKNSLGEFSLNKLTINSFTSPDFKRLTLESDVSDAKVEGNYEVGSLISSIANMAYYYLPAYAPNKDYTKIDSTNNFKFSLHLKDVDSITKVLYPDINLASHTNLDGIIVAKDHKLEMHFNSPSLSVQGKNFDELKIDLETNNHQLELKGRTNRLAFSDDFRLYNLTNKITVGKDKIKLDVLWNNWDKRTYSGYLSAEGMVKKSKASGNPIWNINLLPSTLIMDDSIWNIPSSQIVIDSTSYQVDNFKIQRQNQYFGLDGKISTNPKDSIRFEVHNISLKNLNNLTRDKKIGVNGLVRGYVQLSDLYGNRYSNSNLMIEDLIFNQDTLGNLYLISDWDKDQRKLSFSSFTNYNSKKELSLEGNYFPESDSINMNIDMQDLRMGLLSPYLQDNISNIKGNTSGNLHLEGSTEEPRSSGKLKFKNVSFTINELKTTYYCNDSIKITPKEFQFNKFRLIDQHDKIATIYGVISHEQLQNFNLDLAINTQNFNILNTKVTDNELFYGQAYLTGITHLFGPTDNMDIDITAKTDKNTRIYIPLNNSGDIQESNFITFVNSTHFVNNKESDQYKIDLSGIKMNCDLDITPETEVQIIFDSKIGDVLKAKGNGNLKLEIDTKGDFKIFGDYTIQTGSYLFTLQDVINKKFDLSNGGNIKWTGDPYNATVNINAVYNVKTTLYDLLLNTPYIDNTRKVPVQCNMNLSNRLENPNIKFSIAFPTLDQQTQSILEGLFSTEDEMNKQILSLLVLNRFYTPEYLRSTDPNFENKNSSYAVGITTSELLSNQLSNWLSKISNDFDIGVSYRPGDELTSDEIELALSTQIFNDKITINGNVGTGNSQQRANDIVGDMDVNIKLDKKGKLHLSAFTRSNEYLVYEESRNTQGIGIFYKEDFNTFSGLLKKYLNFLKPTKNKFPHK